MKNKFTKIAALIVALLIGAVVLAGCTSDEYIDRKQKQATVTLDNSLGITAQKERLQREDDPNQIRYVYLFTKNEGKVLGYFTIKGGVYGADTQLAPEQEIICRYSGESCQAVDSAKDNGTYGGGDDGVFFFTTDNVLVETTADYLQSDAPIAFYGDAPRLNEG